MTEMPDPRIDESDSSEPTYVCHTHGTHGLPYEAVQPARVDGEWYWVCKGDVCKPDDMHFESNLDARVAFKRMTGLTIRLTPWELFVAISPKSDTEIVVQIVTHTVDERRTETYLTARGIRLVQFKLVDGIWTETFRLPVVWEDDFQRMTYSHFGPGKTPEQWLQAKLFARQCYRPGSSAQPMDSHHRTTLGYTSTRMANHW